MVFSTVQLAQSAAGKFQFNTAVDEFIPPVDVLNPHAKEFKFSTPAVQTSPAMQTLNFDLYSSDDEAPRVAARHTSKHTTGARLGRKASTVAMQSKEFNPKAKEFVPTTAYAHKPVAPIRPPPGLEKRLGLSVHAKEFVPLPAPTPAAVWHCAVNLDDYTDDESEDETKDTVDIKEWRGLCGRLASPYIWSDTKEEFVDEADTAISDSEADTAEPSSHESESDECSGCESP